MPVFSHLAFNDQAGRLAMQCNPLQKPQQVQEKKIPSDVFMTQIPPPASNNALISVVSEIHGTRSSHRVPPESSACLSSCRSRIFPRPSTRVFCGLLVMFCSSLLAPASPDPLRGGESKFSSTGGEGERDCHLHGLFGPGAQVYKPKPFISGVHTKVKRGREKKKKLN